MTDQSVEILSDITVHNKYARYLSEQQRRETWSELVDRNEGMHQRRYPALSHVLEDLYTDYVLPKNVLPSMRSLQFAGSPIEQSPNRIFNCAYAPVDHPDMFSETMFLLLGGTGVGYSVQRRHVEQLPPLKGPKERSRRYVVGDSIEGWADAVKMLMESYFHNKATVRFDYSDIRPKGAELVTSGGKAPGPQPLRDCIETMRGLLESVVELRGYGTQLKPIEVHDLMCHIADAVLAGGIRRAALISLFSADDMEMMQCKSGPWWEQNPQRGRANNSVILHRGSTTREQFDDIWKRVELSGAGEPGIYFTNNLDWGTNPCAEIALRPHQFCNLTEINASDVTDQEELDKRTMAATLLGTLQAGYTDFHYLRDIWRQTTEEDALLGVSMTGIASGGVVKLDLDQAARFATFVNREIADAIGINRAARITTVKPAGTTSLVLGSSSGIHAWHNDYYIRRMRIGKNEALYSYLASNHPELVEDELFRPETMAVVSVPQRAPESAITREESVFDLLERVKDFNQRWIQPGHRHGDNSHNVSCTISVQDHEWDAVGDWMWENRDQYNGIAVLPYDGGNYAQAPFEDISREEFERLSSGLTEIDLTQVTEEEDNTDLTGEAACAGGQCEIT
ncbi:hypothetical protein [Kushneria phosphatilytica]|uniref:B12-dependent ribonucleotide reductase insertion domain-containing protein n=1 Tax=Kushneria phosphatilytica TaxID=657387 RepID=A0A1S1NSC4_9GAMM|nr:hypothetical protein [Kushneria phosphatilytica]OHV12149.1 hypothetical protein BH688_05710 [Kushneria phosphatilytica]QEL11341.1 hypothetical protein FY550_09445 [Kushneria phosphatilytica]